MEHFLFLISYHAMNSKRRKNPNYSLIWYSLLVVFRADNLFEVVIFFLVLRQINANKTDEHVYVNHNIWEPQRVQNEHSNARFQCWTATEKSNNKPNHFIQFFHDWLFWVEIHLWISFWVTSEGHLLIVFCIESNVNSMWIFHVGMIHTANGICCELNFGSICFCFCKRTRF